MLFLEQLICYGVASKDTKDDAFCSGFSLPNVESTEESPPALSR